MNLSRLNPYKIPIIATSLVAAIGTGALVYNLNQSKENIVVGNSNTIQQVIEKDLKIRGNRSSRIYHMPGCPNYNDIADRNIVNFKTTEEAESKGFRMAKNCN